MIQSVTLGNTALRALPKKEKITLTNLFTLWDPATGNDDDLVLFVKCHNFRDTVGCTRMINIARERKKSETKTQTKHLDCKKSTGSMILPGRTAS